MNLLIFKKIIRTTLIIMAGMIFLMTINGCMSTEVIFRTGSDYEHNSRGFPHNEKKGPPPWAPAHGHRAKHRYHYYPYSQVYYNQNQGSYIYYSNGKWVISVALPDRIKINVNDYVTLEMDTDQPYQYHTEVIKRYPPGQTKKYKGKKGKGKNKW